MIYPYNLTQLCKSDWTIDMHNYMDKSQNNYAEWKKPGTKEYIQYDSAYIAFWKLRMNLYQQKVQQEQEKGECVNI